MDSQHNDGLRLGHKTVVPLVWGSLVTKVLNQGQVVVRRLKEKPLPFVHLDRMEVYRANASPAWMVAKQ